MPTPDTEQQVENILKFAEPKISDLVEKFLEDEETLDKLATILERRRRKTENQKNKNTSKDKEFYQRVNNWFKGLVPFSDLKTAEILPKNKPITDYEKGKEVKGTDKSIWVFMGDRKGKNTNGQQTPHFELKEAPQLK